MSPPAPVANDKLGKATTADNRKRNENVVIEEVEAVKDFGKRMEEKGLLTWWRTSLGYTTGG